MLRDLDETIRAMLKGERRLRDMGVDVSFEIPSRAFSSEIGTTTTINCYLFDIHERRALREDGWQIENRRANEPTRRMPPLFFEMTYLITVWTSSVEDEHYLLWQVLEVLMDNPVLPEKYLQRELKNHEWPIQTSVAQLEGVLKSPGEFWTALENQLKPSLAYTVTLGRQRRAVPTEPAFAPPVLAHGVRVRLPEQASGEAFQLADVFEVPRKHALRGTTVTLVDHDQSTTTDASGMFQFNNLAPGRYVFEATFGEQVQRRPVVIRHAGGKDLTAVSDVVRDQDGMPVAGVEVGVEGDAQRATTNSEGRFTLYLAPGRYTLLVFLAGEPQRMELTVRYSTTFDLARR